MVAGHLRLWPRLARPALSLTEQMNADVLGKRRDAVSDKPPLSRWCIWIPHAQRVIPPAVTQTWRPISVDNRVGAIRRKADLDLPLLSLTRNANTKSVVDGSVKELALDLHSAPACISFQQELPGNVIGELSRLLVGRKNDLDHAPPDRVVFGARSAPRTPATVLASRARRPQFICRFSRARMSSISGPKSASK